MDYSYPTPVPQGMLPTEPMRIGSPPPKRRIPDAYKAQTIVSNLWQANLQRWVQDAAIQGQIDGNPPYSPSKLKAAGRANDPNVNTLEAKARRSAAMVPYYDLFAGGNRYVEVKLAPIGHGDTPDGYPARKTNDPAYNGMGYQDPSLDATRLSEDSGIVSEEYDRLLRRWSAFEQTMGAALADYVTFGRCHLPWEDQDSWCFKRIAFHRVLVPDGTPVNCEEWELILVLQNWTVSRLYALIRDEASAREAGWDIEETMAAIAGAVPVDPTVPDDPMAVQAMVKDADLYVSARSSTIQTATVYVKEYNGKWSEIMVRRDQIPGQIDSNNPAPRTPHFLFKAFDRYECPEEIMSNMFYEVNEGTWNGASGLGRDIFSLMQLKDRTFCAQMRTLFLRSSLILQPRTALDKTKLNSVQFGALTVIPDNFEVHNSTILGDITSTIEISRELDSRVDRNTGIYMPTLEKTPGNPETLGEYQMKFAQATVLSTSAINRFYSQLDKLYAQQWKRVLKCGLRQGGSTYYEKEAREFVRRCEARGVSRDQLKSLESIRAFRNIGQGSQPMRQQALQNLMTLYPVLPENGRENLVEDIIRTSGSQTQVERYLPDADRKKLPSDQLSYALLENAAMRISAPVTWTPSQNNIIHAQAHLQAASQAAASLQQGANPQEVANYLNAVGSHTAVHLQKEQNPANKDAVKALTDQWKQLASFTDGLKRKIQQDAEAQQALQEQAQQSLTEADVKRLDVQLKNQVSREKAAGTLALKKERQDAEMALKYRQQQEDASMEAQRHANTLALEDASTAATVRLDTAKTAADIAHARAKTAAEIENARRKAEKEPASVNG